MNITKKCIALILAVIMVFSMIPLSALAADTANTTVTVDTSKVTVAERDRNSAETLQTVVVPERVFNVNDSFYVPVIVSNLESFDGYNLQMVYNAQVLKFDGAFTSFKYVNSDGDEVTFAKTQLEGTTPTTTDTGIVMGVPDSQGKAVTIDYANKYGYLFFAKFTVIGKTANEDGKEVIGIQAKEGSTAIGVGGVANGTIQFASGTVFVEKAENPEGGGEGGGDSTALTFQMYYTLDKTDGTDAYKDVQLNTAENATNPVTAEIFVVSDQAVTLQAYDIYLSYNSLLSYQSETMAGKAYVNAAKHDVEATAGQTVSHIQMLDGEGTYQLTANTPKSLGTITFDVSKSAQYGEDLHITLANGAINSTNVAVAETGSATGDKTSYWPTVTQEVNGTTYSGVEVMNTYTVTLNANTDKNVTGMPEGNQQTKEYNKDLTLPTLVCTSNELAFKGWTTTPNPGFDAEVQYAPGSSYKANANATLYAVWKQNAYTITLNKNDGTYAEGYTAPSSYVYGVGMTLPAAENISKEHYTFGGWYDNADCTGTAVTEISATDSGAKEYWAKWIPVEYTITFQNEGGAVLQNTTFAYGTTPVYSGATPEKTATAEYTYTFAGWSPAIVEVAGETTYTATYTAKTNSYKVIYAAGENGAIKDGAAAEQTVEYGTKPSFPALTPAPGYELEGWYNGTTKINTDTFVVEGAVTLTAKFKASEYTLILDPNGGNLPSGVTSPITYNIESDKTLPLPELTGSTFVNWKVTTKNGNWDKETYNANDALKGMYGNVTLTAQWTKTGYSVTGGKVTNGTIDVSKSPAEYQDEITVTITPDAGYTMGEGDTVTYTYTENGQDKTGTIEVTENDDGTYTGKFDMPASSVTVTATFTAIEYSITVNNDGHGTATATPSTAIVGTEITLSNTPNTGYKWSSYTIDDVAVSEGKFTMPAKSVTVNVAFEGIDYKIAFNKNAENATGEITTIDGKYDVDATLPTTGFNRTGYTLVGWTDEADGTTAKYTTTAKNLTTTDGATVTLYAVWQAKNINVTLDANGGKIGGQDTKTITPAFDATYGELGTPVREGYTFNGWFTEKTGGTEVEATSKVTNAEDHSLYAKWEAKKYTITFKDSDGETTLHEITADFGSEVSAPETPVKNGYTFDKWVDANGNEVTFPVTMPVDGMTVKATWKLVQYTIKFMDGETELTNLQMSYNIESTGTLPTYDKANYGFSKWEVITADGNWTNGATFDAGTAVTNYYGNVTLTAQWNRTTKTVVEDYKFAATGYVMLRVVDNAADGMVYKFDGQTMYWINNEYYNIDGTAVYYTLIENKYVENGELTEAGYRLLTTAEGNKATITYNGDINGDGTINIADANIVYQMVEKESTGGYYTDLTPAQRLGADMSKATVNSADHRGSINDVNEIIDIINGAKTNP